MDAGLIIRTFEFYMLFMAFVFILDFKIDGKMYFLKVDEKSGAELDAGFKRIVDRIKNLVSWT